MKSISNLFGSVKKRSCLSIDVLFVFSLLLVQCIGIAPAVLHANADYKLSAPTDVKWSTFRYCTATWKSVKGADFYEVTLYHNNIESDESYLVDSIHGKETYSSDLSEAMNQFPDEQYTFTVRAGIGDYEDEDDELIYSEESSMSDIYDEDTVDESNVIFESPIEPEWFNDEDEINAIYYTNNHTGHYYIELYKDNKFLTVIYDDEIEDEEYHYRVINLKEYGNGSYKFRVLVSPIKINNPTDADFESGKTSVFSDAYVISDAKEPLNAPSNVQISDSGILSFDTNNNGAADINYYLRITKPNGKSITFTLPNVTTDRIDNFDLSPDITSNGTYKVRIKAARADEVQSTPDFNIGAVTPDISFVINVTSTLPSPDSLYFDGLTLNWNTVSGAASYNVQLEIFDGQKPVNMARNTIKKTNSFNIENYYNKFKNSITRLRFKARVMAVPSNIKSVGCSNYSAYAEYTVPIEITPNMVTLSANSFVYDGTSKEPAVTVKYNNETLTKGVDYNVAYSNNVNVGTATATVTGIAPFTGSVTINYSITERPVEASTEAAKAPQVGSKETVSDNVYEITSDSSVSYTGTTSGKKNVTIPSTVDINGKSYAVTTIDKNAFENNKTIAKVNIPKTVTRISANAFSGCKNLKNVSVNGNTLKTIEKGAFNNIKKNATITITAKNKKVFDKMVKKIKKSTNVKKLKFKMKKGK